MKKLLLIIGILTIWNLHSQVDSLLVLDDRLQFEVQAADTIILYHESVMPFDFEVVCNKEVVNPDHYHIDFVEATLYLLPSFYEIYNTCHILHLYFKPFPKFLTETHQQYDERNIFPNLTTAQAVSLENHKQNNLRGVPFDGLETQGNLIRGITIGNNQDAVLNSSLDLKIEGKLSSKIALNAHINDTNLPIQENGYSQELKDLDRVYIEMVAPNWNIKAGDIMLHDSTHYFLNFTKKIQGLSIDAKTDDWNYFSSGALVKGRYAYQKFQGLEGNQGPYKLKGQNGELYIFIIQNSEKVYINGILQKKGKNEDYIMDYNTGEIIFTPTNPISVDSRIYIEYQYSDRNYTRLITYDGANYSNKKLTTGITYYKESDLKNQSLDLNLTAQQKEQLSQMGASSEIIWSESASETTYDKNKILYRKIINGLNHYFEYSENPSDVLYEVHFTYFGANEGDYQVQEYLAVGKKMIYVGENLGSYKAVIPIHAPTALQLAVANADFCPNEKTDLSIEIALSNTQNNLFSKHNSEQKTGVKSAWKQTIWDKKWKGSLMSQLYYLEQNFKTPEKLFQIEFNKDWDLQQVVGNQTLFISQFNLENENKDFLNLKYEKLQFSDYYNGNRWISSSSLHWKYWKWQHKNSYLKSNDKVNESHFLRQFYKITLVQKKWWTSWDLNFEQNKIWNNTTQVLNTNSFKMLNHNIIFGLGDTTKIYLKTGIQIVNNDSVKSNQFNHFYKSKSAWLETKILQNEKSQLFIYSFLRNSDFVNLTKILSFTNKINYNLNLWKNLVQLQTEYQNFSGQLAQQDFNYIETEPGQGYYTWIDYNKDGIKELDEFEIAQFQDQANYLRVALPNISYLPTQEAKFRHQLSLNLSQLSTKKGLLKLLSHFSNQSNITAENAKLRKVNELNLNPFNTKNNVLHYNTTLQNQLFFNQGKGNFTTGYIFNKSNQKLWQSFGTYHQDLILHQMVFHHLIENKIQIGFDAIIIENKSTNEYYFNRDFNIHTKEIKPNLTYLFDKNHWIKVAYQTANKSNRINQKEQLKTKKLIVNYQYTGVNEMLFSTNVQYIQNYFNGLENSAVGYQMLEGLNKGKNAIWTVLWTKKLNDFLYLNLNYSGRVNETSPAIHNGSVQLRAQF